MAAIPDDEFEQALAATDKPTTAGWSVPRVMAALGRTQLAIYTRARNMGLGRWGRAVRLPPAGSLQEEIEAALRERATAPLYRPGSRI
jgi:hypothetical protein